MNKKKLLKLTENLGLSLATVVVDARSPNFFHVKDSSKNNFMILIKEEFPRDFVELYKNASKRYVELPCFQRENEESILFSLPKGKLRRITAERLSIKDSEEIVNIQKKLALIYENTPYSWQFELEYFFITPIGLMYIDVESIQEDLDTKFINPKPFSELTLKERVQVKIMREKSIK